jgi:hypothetical protein
MWLPSHLHIANVWLGLAVFVARKGLRKPDAQQRKNYDGVT